MPGQARAEGGNKARARWRTLVPTSRTCGVIALSPDDADAYYELVDRNRTHLTQHGDWTDLGDATQESVQTSLSDLDDRNAQFGNWLEGRLIGRTDLNARTPGKLRPQLLARRRVHRQGVRDSRLPGAHRLR